MNTTYRSLYFSYSYKNVQEVYSRMSFQKYYSKKKKTTRNTKRIHWQRSHHTFLKEDIRNLNLISTSWRKFEKFNKENSFDGMELTAFYSKILHILLYSFLANPITTKLKFWAVSWPPASPTPLAAMTCRLYLSSIFCNCTLFPFSVPFPYIRSYLLVCLK